MRQWMWMPVFILAACAPDPEVQTLANRPAPEVSPTAGCWQAEAGSWSPDRDSVLALGPVSNSLSTFWIVRFDTLPPPIVSPDRPDTRMAETFIEGAWRDFPFQRWWTTGDSLFIDHPAAFSGTTLRLIAGPDGFDGLATAHSDVQVAGESRFRYAAAALRRIACPQ